jgi:hypothetical protein
MRPITLALTITLAGCSSSCGGTSKPAVNWPRIVACTEPAQFDLLAQVQKLLVTPDPEAGDTSTIGDRAVHALEDMARKHAGTLLLVQVQRRLVDHDRRITQIEIVAAEIVREREVGRG